MLLMSDDCSSKHRAVPMIFCGSAEGEYCLSNPIGDYSGFVQWSRMWPCHLDIPLNIIHIKRKDLHSGEDFSLFKTTMKRCFLLETT